ACVRQGLSLAIRSLSPGSIKSVIARRFSPPATTAYTYTYFPGRITLFTPIEGPRGDRDPYMGWRGLASEMEAHSIPGNRHTIFKEPHVRVLAERLQSCLDRST